MANTETAKNDAGPSIFEAEPDELVDEVGELIAMLKHEIGLRWMSLSLRLQIEKIEILLRER